MSLRGRQESLCGDCLSLRVAWRGRRTCAWPGPSHMPCAAAVSSMLHAVCRDPTQRMAEPAMSVAMRWMQPGCALVRGRTGTRRGGARGDVFECVCVWEVLTGRPGASATDVMPQEAPPLPRCAISGLRFAGYARVAWLGQIRCFVMHAPAWQAFSARRRRPTSQRRSVSGDDLLVTTTLQFDYVSEPCSLCKGGPSVRDVVAAPRAEFSRASVSAAGQLRGTFRIVNLSDHTVDNVTGLCTSDQRVCVALINITRDSAPEHAH